VPLDVHIRPRAVVLGLPKSGKSTLATEICEQTGAIHLEIAGIIERYVDHDCAAAEKLRTNLKKEGRGIEDQSLVRLIVKRLQCRDVLANGWVLEDFPKTRQQAALLARHGVTPANVFHMRIPAAEVFRRTESEKDEVFSANRTILSSRMRNQETHMPQVLALYQRLYNSLCEIDGMKSKWYVNERAMSAIQANVEAKQRFARNYFFVQSEPSDSVTCEVADLNCDRVLLKASLS